jgi:opacity protein-like surface antigen
MHRGIALGAALAAASLSCASAAQAAEARPWSLAVSAGYEYDSNVTVEQTDVNTGVGDSAADLGVDASYRLIGKTDGPQLRASYGFSQSLHATQTAFDIQSHVASLSGSVPVGKATAGLDYSFFHMLLGGRSFLDMHMASPSVSGFVARNLYARASYTYFDKSFAPAYANRDAHTHQAGADLYYFFDRARAFVTVGGRYEAENTVDPQLVFRGYVLNADLQLPVEVIGRRGKIKLGYAYRRRDYDNVTVSLGAKRWENRSVFKVAAETPLVGRLSLHALYQYTDRSSNYLAANYTENQVSAGLKYAF